ncbi:MAG: TlpA disulfide reductase family protein [Candidatus Promineifilaceae bacterium]|nr:TlpA disulfide reductase family protein [Candidatus Promineifilaceae bacterium]
MTELVEPTATPSSEEKTAEPQPTKEAGINWMSVGIWAAVIGLLAVLGWGLVKTNADRPGEGQIETAPNFEVQFFDGYEWEGRSTASLEDFRGQPVVLNFWASWCVECRLEADALEQTWRRYRDQGVVFLGVAYVDVEPKSKAYLEEFDITYPNAPDLRSSVSSKYEVTGVPETFFINPAGEVTHVQIGPVNEATLTGLIDRMLSEG